MTKSFRLTEFAIKQWPGLRVRMNWIGDNATINVGDGQMVLSGKLQDMIEAGLVEEMLPVVDLRAVQSEALAWSEHNFGMPDLSPEDQRALLALTGVAEETGEIVRAIRKMCQGIQGTREEWIEEIKKEAGDVVIQLMSGLNALDIDINDCLCSRWTSVSKRDWKKYPKNGVSE